MLGPQSRGGVEGSGGGDGIPFFSLQCDQTVTGTTNCIPTCVFPGCFLSPPPPPSPAYGKPTQSHLAPLLIAGVSILGILFLLLTTCTIILRYQFRSIIREGDDVPSPHSLADDDGDAIDHPIWLINTVGLQQSVIDSITAFKFSKLDGILIDGADCSVCLTEFDDGDDLRLLPKCSHAFHVNCIDIWLRSHKNCPLCRAPVVKDSNFSLNLLGSGDLDDHLNNNAENNQMTGGGGGGESSIRAADDVLVDLPIEGVKLAEILLKNRELRILSDLGEYHRFRGENDGVDLVKRSISFNSSASLAIHRAAMDDVYYLESEGSSSSNNRLLVDENKIEFDNDKETKKGSSMSGLSMKSSSIGRTLQKGSVSMKRSISSSSKLFSFRRSKSQASVLPLSLQISDAHNK